MALARPHEDVEVGRRLPVGNCRGRAFPSQLPTVVTGIRRHDVGGQYGLGSEVEWGGRVMAGRFFAALQNDGKGG